MREPSRLAGSSRSSRVFRALFWSTLIASPACGRSELEVRAFPHRDVVDSAPDIDVSMAPDTVDVRMMDVPDATDAMDVTMAIDASDSIDEIAVDIVLPVDVREVADVLVPVDAGCRATLSPEVTFPIACISMSIAVGDLDRDGRADVVVNDFNRGGPNLGVLHSLPGRMLSAETNYPARGERQSTVIADLDRDGWPDIIVQDYSLSNVDVYINDGHGAFASPLSYPAGDGRLTAGWALAVDDFDRDGWLDVAVGELGQSLGSSAGGVVGVLRNAGRGVLLPQVVYPDDVVDGLPGGAYYRGVLSIATGDFNGDSYPDIALSASDAHVGILLNDGTGHFGAQIVYPMANRGPSGTSVALVVADFDLDGHVDLAATNPWGPTPGLFMNAGDGTLRPEIPVFDVASGGGRVHLAAADIDHDGRTDLVIVRNGINTFSNLTGTTFDTPVVYSEATGFVDGMAVGDIDGDGLLDVAIADDRACVVGVYYANCR